MTQRERMAMFDWPFLPIEELEFGDRFTEWATLCHVTAPFDDLLADPQRSVVVITHRGCGLSTSLRLLKDAPLLLFPYPVSQWPDQRDAFNTEATHFGQWMGHIADAFISRVRQQPETIRKIRPHHGEFLAWLARRYLGRRHALSLLQLLEAHLPPERVQPLQHFAADAEVPPLFHETVSGTLGQIGEALDIAALLGWQGIFACVDLSFVEWIKATGDERNVIQRQLRELLSALTPLTRSNFGIKVSLPDIIMRPEQARAIVRDRAVVTVAYWEAERLERLALRLVTAAVPDAPLAAGGRIAGVLRALQGDIQLIYGRPGPETIRLIAQTVCASSPEHSSAELERKVRLRLYQSGARLRLDGDPSTRRLWRGAEPIILSENHFDLFALLWRHQGDYVNADALLKLGGSKANVDQMVARLRKTIEPSGDISERVYLHRDRSGPRLLSEHCDFF